MKARMLRFRNKRFLRLFVNNTILVFSGIAVLLTITTVTIYIFANRQLMREVDAANLRGVETALSTIDAVVMASRGAAIRFALDMDVRRLVGNPDFDIRDFDYIQRTTAILHNMRLSLRSQLDYSMFLHLDVNEYSICSRRGGQLSYYHPDRNIADYFNRLRESRPNTRNFTVFRQAYFDVLRAHPVPLLTFYQEIIGLPGSQSFIAVNVDVKALAEYLGGVGLDDSSRFIMIDETGLIIMDTKLVMAGNHISGLIYNESDIEKLLYDLSGSLTTQIDNETKRLSWLSYPRENWTLMQFIPFDAYMESMVALRGFIVAALAVGLMFSGLISLLVTRRLFRPISDIIRIVEDPKSYDEMHDRSGETKSLLISVLQSFQKNIVMEEEMLHKISALRESRAIALQEQINPHFLYNTLQAISWLATAETAKKASDTSKAIITLSEMIRGSMEKTNNFTTVTDELEHFERYMEIVHLRYGEEIDYKCSISPGIEGVKILRITLQPLAENAIIHGLQPKGGVGTVYVDISITEGSLRVCVEDDGEGMSDGALQEYNNMLARKAEDMFVKSHIGLLNLCQRVKLIYGEQYGLKVSRSGHGGLKVEVFMGVEFWT